jgi:peptidoglycan/LPS O-acetylase OafA/YrhL
MIKVTCIILYAVLVDISTALKIQDKASHHQNLDVISTDLPAKVSFSNNTHADNGVVVILSPLNVEIFIDENLKGKMDNDKLALSVREATSAALKLLKSPPNDATITFFHDLTERVFQRFIKKGPPTTDSITRKTYEFFAKLITSLWIFMAVGIAVVRYYRCSQSPSVESSISSSDQGSRVFLDHLSGLRVLLLIWILMDHFTSHHYNYDPEIDTLLSHVNRRGKAAVSCFLILSGFLNQLHSTDGESYGKYCLRKWGRIAGSYYTALLFYACVFRPGFNIICWQPSYDNTTEFAFGMLWSSTLMQTWLLPFIRYGRRPINPSGILHMPNAMTSVNYVDSHQLSDMKTLQLNPPELGPPTAFDLANPSLGLSYGTILWTVSCLWFAWCMHPWLKSLLKKVNPNSDYIVTMMITFWCYLWSMVVFTSVYSVAPTVADGTFFFPVYWSAICQLPQYCLGICVAELLIKYRSLYGTEHRHEHSFALLADVSLFGGASLIVFTPALGRMAMCEFEWWWPYGLGVIWASYLFFSCSTKATSLTHMLLGNQIMSKLGNYSFAMYVLQEPLFQMLDIVFHGTGTPGGYPHMNLQEFIPCVAILFFLSYACTKYIEKPVADYVRQKTSTTKTLK